MAVIRTFLIGTFLLAMGAPAGADVGEELASLKANAEAQVAGGALEKKASKATTKLLKAIDKAEAIDTDPAKYLKKVAAVLKKADKAAGKGVDFGAADDDLLMAVEDAVDDQRDVAVVARDGLYLEKDTNKVAKKIAKGDAKVTKADGAPTAGKKANSLAKAFKQYVKAQSLGTKLRQKEIDKGLVVFDVVTTTLDSSSVYDPGTGIQIEFNLEVNPDQIRNLIRVTDGQGLELTLDVIPQGPTELTVFVLDPLQQGTDYSLEIPGEDTQPGAAAASIDGVFLLTTYAKSFTGP
jgi:hypothetical protein